MTDRGVRGQGSGVRTGLTLVEVMLALAILGVGLSVLIATASKCLSVIRQSRNYETARHLIGRVELEHPLQLEEKIEEGTEEGSFTGNYPGYRWSRAITLIGKEEDGLYSVLTRVLWSERGLSVGEQVETYLYKPEEKEGGTVVSR
ncbi:MAG: prepilin-type N-terminal cleavage/methylation domain-containing protein [Verrucomicrobiota bacterium]